MFSGAQSSGKTSVNSSLTAKTASTAVLDSSCLDGGSGHPQTCPNVKRSSQTQATSSSKKQPNSPSSVTELSQAKNKQLSKMHPQAGPVDYQQVFFTSTTFVSSFITISVFGPIKETLCNI